MIPRTRSVTLLGHSPFQVLEEEGPRFGRFNALATQSTPSGGQKTRLGYSDVVLEHEEKTDPIGNKATIFRFKETKLICDSEVELADIKTEMLRVARDSKTIILNFKGVGGLDSQALGTFINGLRHAGKKVAVCSPSEQLSQQLKITRLNTLILCSPNEAVALHTLAIDDKNPI